MVEILTAPWDDSLWSRLWVPHRPGATAHSTQFGAIRALRGSSAGAFLFLNDFALESLEEDELLTMIAVADHALDERALAKWLETHSTRA
jgi:hypothetical protein